MNKKPLSYLLSFIPIVFFHSHAYAHFDGEHAVTLHLNNSYEECAMIVDPSLTQSELSSFTKDVASIMAFSPMQSARTLKKGKFDISLLMQKTGEIQDYTGAWNNTFSHPNSTHYLTEDHTLSFPALTLRLGLDKQLDVGAILTAAPGANYGFLGADVKRGFLNEADYGVSMAARLKYVALVGPQDLSAHQGGVDLIASRTYGLFTPYAGVSGLLTRVAETTDKVNLSPVYKASGIFSLGGELDWNYLNVGIEANIATVNTYKVKIGAQF